MYVRRVDVKIFTMDIVNLIYNNIGPQCYSLLQVYDSNLVVAIIQPDRYLHLAVAITLENANLNNIN